MKNYFTGCFTVGYGFVIMSIFSNEYIKGLIILGILSTIGILMELIVYKRNVKQKGEEQ